MPEAYTMLELMEVEAVTGGCGTVWADIRGMSCQLLDSARKSDWKSALEFQARRDGLIRRFFSGPVRASDADSVREGILEILEMDKEVMALTREGRSRTGAKIYQLQSGRKAQKAYAETQTNS